MARLEQPRGGYGSVPTAGKRRVRFAVTAAAVGAGCAVLGALAAVTLPPASRPALLQWRGGAARQQELSDVVTAPLERVARSLGNTLARAVHDGSALSTLEQEQGVPTWEDPAALTAGTVATAGDYKCFIESDFYLKYMRSCCKTMYWPPSAQEALPGLMSLPLAPAESPADLGKPFGVRFRYFLGDGNDIVFNGGTEDTIRFINRFFGYDIKTTPVRHRFTRKAQAYVHGEPVAHVLYPDLLHLMPQTLPNYEGITAVDVSSLPKGESTVIYDDVPPGNHWDPEEHDVASPGFRLKYCEAADHLGDLNGGLPMKIRPADCGAIMEKYNMRCKCGNIFFLGWVWPKAEENIYEKSLMRMDRLALGACQAAPPKEPVPMPKIAPPPGGGSKPEAPADPLQACKDAPSYDPAAQNWYYDTNDGTRMVRHWCPSVWVPQEQWYKYQRYVPRSNNNQPAPPINDFDFLNSFARDYYKESRAKARIDANTGLFDDFTLGNFPAAANIYSHGEKRDESEWTSRGRIPPVRFPTIVDNWNLGKMSCVGGDCHDGTHHGGVHANGGIQPYDDYRHMNDGDDSVAVRHGRGRRPPSLAQQMQQSQEEEHVEEEHTRGLTVLDPRLNPASLARPPTGASDDDMY
jgi:hypothetical protein